MCIDELRFEAAKNRVIGINRERQGIGTLSEKTVHAVLKNYYAPDTDMHEIPIENFVADIFTGTEIMEKPSPMPVPDPKFHPAGASQGGHGDEC